jgi:hypothetical protein
MSIIRKWKRLYLYPGLLKANRMIKTNPKPKSKPHRKKGQSRENPVSLAPLGFKDALAGLLAVKPEPKTKKRKAKQKPDSE